jgi:hypothetical protein
MTVGFTFAKLHLERFPSRLLAFRSGIWQRRGMLYIVGCEQCGSHVSVL